MSRTHYSTLLYSIDTLYLFNRNHNTGSNLLLTHCEEQIASICPKLYIKF